MIADIIICLLHDRIMLFTTIILRYLHYNVAGFIPFTQIQAPVKPLKQIFEDSK